MAIRKCRVKQWALKLNDGRFASPETLVWELAARGELANIRGKLFLLLILIAANAMRGSITKLRPQRQ
eukprot:2377696-Heterocapsa_arctica.AAC.1